MDRNINKYLLIGTMAFLLMGCNTHGGKTGKNLVDNSPTWGITAEEQEEETVEEDLIVYAEYTPKASFTTVASMEAQMPQTGDFELGQVNKKFLEGCYYTGNTSTPFLASFAERWNRTTFLRHFVNAEELFERENSNVGDSLTSETVRGKMPMLPNEYQLAFKNSQCQILAKRLVRMLSSIDYVPEQTGQMAKSFRELVNMPYDTPELLSDVENEETEAEFWQLYDKSKYVADYEKIREKRLPEDVDYDELQRLSLPLQERYIAEESFDAKCIYALEMGCYGFPKAIDYLGELIEDGRYSPYLFEVWYSWRLRAQSHVYGISTFSEIPDNLYDNARLLIAKAYLKHIEENPTDNLAKVLLVNLMYTENLHRVGGYYGNEALGAERGLRMMFFLPDELIND